MKYDISKDKVQKHYPEQKKFNNMSEIIYVKFEDR